MELFTITINNAIKFYYTSNETDISIDDGNGNIITYKSIPISRKELTMDLQTSNFIITAPLSEEPFMTISPANSVIPIEVTVVRYPEGILLYRGNVKATKHDYSRGKVEITLQSRFMELEGECPRKTYSTTCSYKLGDNDCRVDLENGFRVHLESGDFTLDGADIIADEFQNAPDPEFYTSGFVRANTGEVIYITKFDIASKKVTLLTRFYDNSAITSLDVYAGCNKKYETCTVRFNNGQNFGGFPYIPAKNPTLQGFR